MALKSSNKKASGRAVSAAKPVTKKKPVIRAAKTSAGTARAASKTKPAPVKRPKRQQEVTFSLFAPQAGSVLVAGDFTGWGTSPIRLAKEAGGTWKTTVALMPGTYQYRLLVDGHWQNDPACPDMMPNEFGSSNCVLSVAA